MPLLCFVDTGKCPQMFFPKHNVPACPQTCSSLLLQPTPIVQTVISARRFDEEALHALANIARHSIHTSWAMYVFLLVTALCVHTMVTPWLHRGYTMVSPMVGQGHMRYPVLTPWLHYGQNDGSKDEHERHIDVTLQSHTCATTNHRSGFGDGLSTCCRGWDIFRAMWSLEVDNTWPLTQQRSKLLVAVSPCLSLHEYIYIYVYIYVFLCSHRSQMNMSITKHLAAGTRLFIQNSIKNMHAVPTKT